MVIHTERSPKADQAIAALREVFDASVMNFGSYNLLYARNLAAHTADAQTSAPSEQTDTELSVQEAVSRSHELLVGYRREPVELVLCPVNTDQLLKDLGEPESTGLRSAKTGKNQGDDDAAVAEVPALLNLTNLAGMATDASTVQIAFSTGRRVTLDVQPIVTFAQTPDLRVNQQLDVEDFYDFLDYFMDRVEFKYP